VAAVARALERRVTHPLAQIGIGHDAARRRHQLGTVIGQPR